MRSLRMLKGYAEMTSVRRRRRRLWALLAVLLVSVVPVVPTSAATEVVEAPEAPVVKAPEVTPVVEVITAAGRFWPGDACVVREGALCARSDQPVTITQGTTLRLRNYDVPHDLRSEALTPEGRSLFASPRVFFGDRAEVVINTKEGVLPVGTYRFYCTLHPPAPDGTGMRGILKVVKEVSV